MVGPKVSSRRNVSSIRNEFELITVILFWLNPNCCPKRVENGWIILLKKIIHPSHSKIFSNIVSEERGESRERRERRETPIFSYPCSVLNCWFIWSFCTRCIMNAKSEIFFHYFALQLFLNSLWMNINPVNH